MKLVNNKKLMEAVNNIGLSNVEQTIVDAKQEDVVTEVEIPIGMGDNYAESQKAKKHFMQVIDEKNKEAKEVILDEPGTGKALEKNMYTKTTLDESLFEAVSDLSPDNIEQKVGFEDWPEDEKAAKALAKEFIGKWISELGPDEYDLYNTIYQDLVHNPTAAGGNIPGPKGYRATADMELQDIDANISAFDDGIKVKGKDTEALEKAKKIAMRYYDYGVFYEMKDFNDKHKYYTKELFIFIPETDDFNETTPIKRTGVEEVEESVKKPIKEANVIKDIDLNVYESNEAGQVTLDRIKEAGKVGEFEKLLEDMYPNGINEATLDDLLRFESDWLFDMLGISNED